MRCRPATRIRDVNCRQRLSLIFHATIASTFPRAGFTRTPSPPIRPRLLLISIKRSPSGSAQRLRIRTPISRAFFRAIRPRWRESARARLCRTPGQPISPQLADGRALLLGEFIVPDSARLDIPLEGPNQRPFRAMVTARQPSPGASFLYRKL